MLDDRTSPGDSVVQEFEALWATDALPDVVEFLQQRSLLLVDSPDSITLLGRILITDLEQRFRRQKHNATAILTRRYLRRMPKLPGSIVQELILCEVRLRTGAGEAVNVAEFIRRIPELKPADAEGLTRQLEVPRTLTVSPAEAEREQQQSGHGTDPPQVIGPYTILQKLGEGGMGSVYLVQQNTPVRRRVALKVVRSGLNSEEVQKRFEAERQALALMDHQNIARVLDAGITSDGRPYFAMELVKGIPITEYCDRYRLGLNQRLELFNQTCQAVQHAHQKGIIHRDIKPSNVLVSQESGEPLVKVIDFGLAKALQATHRLTDSTMFTEFGQIVGTLQYMSPEQAELNALDIDTRSDVYSLGVLLYELLTGSTPLDREAMKIMALDRVLAAIREQEAPRPSQRLSSSGIAAVNISDLRQTEPRRLAAILRGDLDWIVMKALEKERTRRYESAAQFAEDVRLFLTDQPVNARPPSFSYRLLKAARRHRRTIPVALVLAVAAIAGSAILLRQWQENMMLATNLKLANSESQLLATSLQLANSESELLAANARATEESLRASERDRIIQQLAARNLMREESPDELLSAIDDAVQLEMMDAAGRCQLQLSQLELLYSLQRFPEARELLAALDPIKPVQQALQGYWKVRMSPAIDEERAAARQLLNNPIAAALPRAELLLLEAMTQNSRGEALPILAQLLDESPGSIEGRKLLAACLLFEGQHADVLHHTQILRILTPNDPETEIALAMSFVLQNDMEQFELQLERLRRIVPESDMRRLHVAFDELTRMSGLLRRWDSGGATVIETVKSIIGFVNVLSSFVGDNSVLERSLNTLNRSVNLQDEASAKGSLADLGLRFLNRLLIVSTQTLIGNNEPLRSLLDDLAAASPFQHDAFFSFTKGVTWLNSNTWVQAIDQLERADQAPCMFAAVKPEILYCLSMAWAGRYVQTRNPEALANAAAAADRWAAIATDFHGGRVGNLLPTWKAAGDIDTALSVLDRAEGMYPENRNGWNLQRMDVFRAGSRDGELIRLADQLLMNPQLADEQRATYSALRDAAAMRLTEVLNAGPPMPKTNTDL